MTDQVSTLVLAADSRQVKTAATDLDRLAASGKKVEDSTDRVNSVMGALRGTLGSLGALEAARRAVLLADSYASVSSRLSLVTTSSSNLAQVQARLFDVSQRTRVGLEQTSDLFSSLTRATKSLGASQSDVIRTVETVNKALIISGASAASANAALVQLGQGLSSGALRGDELNSILEQTPRLAQAIADGLGVPIGRLREMGAAGELTAEKVFNALQKAAEGIDREFGKMSITVGQALTVAGNSIGTFISTLDKLTGTTPAIAAWIVGFSRRIDQLGEAARRNNGFLAGLVNSAQITTAQESLSVVNQLLEEARGRVSKFEALEAKGGLTVFDATALKNARDDVVKLTAEIERLDNKIKGLRNQGSGKGPDESFDRAEEARLGRSIAPAVRLQRQQDALKQFYLDNATAGEKFRAELKKQKEALGDLFTADVEKRLKEKFFPKGNEAAKTYEREIQSEREKLALIGQETELERVKALIKAGAYRGETAQQLAQRQYIAIEIDRANELVQLKKDEEKARDAVTAAITRAAQASIKELEDLDNGNDKIRKEIELLGASEQARAAIERAYISSTIARKQDQIAALESQGIDERQLQVLEREIELLRERLELISKRANRKDEVEAQEEARKAAKKAAEEGTEFAKQAARNIQDAMGETILKTLEGDFKSIGALWANLLKRMAAEALAAQLGQALFGDFGKTGQIGGGIGQIFNAIGTSIIPDSPFWAKGGAFGPGGQIKAYANGDVFGSPTAFRYAGDRMGIMGEAGPEAIMPLRRGKDGKLGVQAAGSSAPQIVNHFNIPAGVTRNEFMAAIPAIEARIMASVQAKATRPGGR